MATICKELLVSITCFYKTKILLHMEDLESETVIICLISVLGIRYIHIPLLTLPLLQLGE
jgi:hypothetical protein